MTARETLAVLVIGRGRLGSSVARALRASGAEVAHWPGRGRWPARAPDVDVTLLAVADPFLEATASRLAPRLHRGCPVLHVSGARGASVLAALAPRPLGVLHPLVSFGSRRAAIASHAVAVVAGDRRAVRAARALSTRIGLTTVHAEIHGPRYHAAAALLANGAAALATRAVDALERQGLRRDRAEQAIAGLLHSVADNVSSVGVPAALTGPIARGDADTVRAHRAALDGKTLRAYEAIAPIVLEVAAEAGLPEAKVRAVRAALTRAGNRARPRRA